MLRWKASILTCVTIKGFYSDFYSDFWSILSITASPNAISFTRFLPWMFFSISGFLFWVRCVVIWRINSLVAAAARSTLFREASSTLKAYDDFFGSAALLTHLLQDSCSLHRIRRPPRIYPPDSYVPSAFFSLVMQETILSWGFLL